MTPRVRVRVAAQDEAGVAVPGEGGRLPVGGWDGEAVGRVHDERPRGGRTGTGRRSPTGSHDRTGEHGEGGGGGGGPGSTVGGTCPAGGRGARTRGPAGEPGLPLGRVRARRANPYSRTSGTGGAGTDRTSAPGATAMLRARPVPPAGGDSRAPSRAAACVHLNRAVSLGMAPCLRWAGSGARTRPPARPRRVPCSGRRGRGGDLAQAWSGTRRRRRRAPYGPTPSGTTRTCRCASVRAPCGGSCTSRGPVGPGDRWSSPADLRPQTGRRWLHAGPAQAGPAQAGPAERTPQMLSDRA